MTVTVLGLTTEEAVRLTERIRVALDRVASSWADLGDRVAEAYERRADLALGYDSWESYASAELRPSEGIAAEVRRELVGLLSARGMSTRAIAPVVAVQHSAVAKDLRRAGVSIGHTSPVEPERIDTLTGEVVTEPTKAERIAAEQEQRRADVAARPVTIGLDGKSYSRPEPKTVERRRPIGDAFWEAAYDLNRKVESLARLVADDRFATNRTAIAGKNLPTMRTAANTLAGVLAALENNSQKA